MTSNKVGEGSGHAAGRAGHTEGGLKGAGRKAELLMSSEAARVGIDRRRDAKTGEQEEAANHQRDSTTTSDWKTFKGRKWLHERMRAVKYRLWKSESSPEYRTRIAWSAGRGSRGEADEV